MLIVVGTAADDTEKRYRNIRLFWRNGERFVLEFWYNYELTSQ
jgi:hypothetical protein